MKITLIQDNIINQIKITKFCRHVLHNCEKNTLDQNKEVNIAQNYKEVHFKSLLLYELTLKINKVLISQLEVISFILQMVYLILH